MYQLPERLHEGLLIVLGDQNFMKLTDLLEDLYTLNNVFLNDIDFNFDELEEDLANAFDYETGEEDDIIYYVYNKLHYSLASYLKQYGITFVETEEPLVYFFIDLIHVLRVLYTIDNNLIEEYLDLLEDNLEKDEEETFSYLVSTITERTYNEVIELLEYVSPKFFKRFINFYNKEIDSRTVELSPSIVKLLESISLIDSKYLDTYIVKYISKYGYTPFTFASMEDTLYKVIQDVNYTANATLANHRTYEDIAREIVMFYYLAEDTRGTKINILEEINLTWADDLYPEQNINGKVGSLIIRDAFTELQSVLLLRMGHVN